FIPNTKILLVDGEMFSWYGSRLLKAPNYFNTLQQQIRMIV
ncbi:MAG: cobalamin-binding protein, partial [Chitinophagaceae bacterium]